MSPWGDVKKPSKTVHVLIEHPLLIFKRFLQIADFFPNRCLNFHNMGKEGQSVKDTGCHDGHQCAENSLPEGEGDNNNLVWAARVLEMVYNNKNLKVPRLEFRGTSPKIDDYRQLSETNIEGSLQERGKSRADLWALAALTGIISIA